MEEIDEIDKKTINYKNELADLKNKEKINENNIMDLKNELDELNGKSINNVDESALQKAKKKLDNLEKDQIILKTQISEKNEDITNLSNEKDNLIKKCLMKLHAEMKKNYRQVNEDHDKYVELYTQAREERHSIERKMMNLKVLVYKNYKLRLV